MMTAYEAVFIVATGQSDEFYTGVVEKYRGVVNNSGGNVTDLDRWDARRLAYEVKGKREGVYFVMNFTSEAASKDELDRIFRITDDTLRHLIVKQDKKADATPGQTRAAEQERRDREFAARAAANAEAEAAKAEAAPVADAANVTDLSAASASDAEATDTPEEIAASEAEPEPATATEEE
jgi:small subunit ribosomal protein S6